MVWQGKLPCLVQDTKLMKIKPILFYTWASLISLLTINNTTLIAKLQVDRSFDLSGIESTIQSLNQSVYEMRQELNVPTYGNFE